MRRPARGVALAWLLLVGAFPFGGAFIYFMIGERRIGSARYRRLEMLQQHFRKMIGREIPRDLAIVEWSELPPAMKVVDTVGRTFFGLPGLEGNDVKLIPDTEHALAWLTRDVDAAQSFVLMEFYIWNQGGAADAMVEALIRAGKRGVRCYVLVDAVGGASWWKGPQPAKLREAGVQLHAALPVGIFRALIGRFDLRLHRKTVVIDGKLGWTGSMNLADPRFFKQSAGVGEWVDAMVRLEGPVVTLLAAVIAGDWSAETGSFDAEIVSRLSTPVQEAKGSSVIQVIPSGPDETQDGLLQIFLALINAASREVVLTTPYFVPDDSLVTALRGALARGVRVILIVPEKIDSRFVRFASRSFFEELLDLGGEIHLFKGGLLHTKSITVDGCFALFGTANFDMRSLWLNYELSLLIYDETLAAVLRKLQQDYIEDAVSVDRNSWMMRPFAVRFVEALMRLMAPLL